jgi:zinc protease
MILTKKVQLVLAFVILGLFPSLPALAVPPVQRMVVSNGLVFLVSGETSLPFVTMALFVDSGSWRDPRGQEGLSYLTAKGLLLGTPQRDAVAINEALDFMGISLTASSTRDYTAVTLRVLKKDLDKGLDLLMEVLTQPIFPEKELQREVEKTLAAIQSEEDQPDEVAEKAFQKELFGTGPYGHPVEGTKESLPRLTRDEVIRFHSSFFHPNHSILSVVGDITAQEVHAKILPRFEKWPKGTIQGEAVVATFAEAQKTLRINRSITQANIILGQAGVRRDNPDYYALTVMNYILGGGGFSSRLMEEIRNKRGLAYSVGSFFDYGKYPGSFQIVLQTKNASAREGISLSLQQMERIRKELVSEKEMEGARKYLVGSFPMRFDTQAKLVNFLSQMEYYGLGLDYPEKYPALIQSVTREEVLRVAQKYLHPENHILVVVANLREAGLE